MEQRVIGITGGVGAGKSAVLSILKEIYHAQIIEADQIGHEVMEPGAVCYEQVVNRFGRRILKPDGTIDRGLLGGIVFSDGEALESLNAIVHPAVKKEVRERIEKSRAPIVAVEAALLLEDHYDDFCSEVWYVSVPIEERIRRLMTSRSYSREKCLAVMENQLPEEEFLKRCHFVIDNSQNFSYTKEQIAGLLKG